MQFEYAENLQNFIREFFAELDVPYLILRGEELLPVQSGFDIDILIDTDSIKSFIKLCTEYAERFNLVMLNNKKRILLFHLDYNSNQRNWLILDLQTQYAYGQTCLNLSMMLSMPQQQRIDLIRDVQDARKGRASKDIQNKLGITPYAKTDAKAPNLLQKIKRKVLMNAFFIHWHTMPFVVISGPDGVGKTTLLSNITRLLESQPFIFTGFHHTNLVKDKNFQHNIAQENMSLLRKFRRKFTPVLVKRIYGAVMGELKYAMKINREVIKGFYSGTIVFSDRYIYDRAIKMRMHPDKMLISKITTRLNSYLMRNPMVMIIPTDAPEEIYKRKQELTTKEIARYYDEMDRLTKHCKSSKIHKITVSGKTAEDLAKQATALILTSLSPLIFHLVGTYEKELKR